ncbi:AfsR/SARP family transcriptional regulator [Saccharopolyspora cebuensis]|uniref:AfsR/SARP family transcriptional regulator n=1 Tax=Saccharopolyspora cebuensis TaxID=418759 RepID=A0ABV4CD88_9PSEU
MREVGMRVEVLGPFRIWDGAVEVDVGPNQRRMVFAALVLNANRPVRVGALAQVLWGDEPPPTAAGCIQSHISRIRARLGDVTGPAMGVRTLGHSYLLRADPEWVDALRFRGLAERADAVGGVEAIGLYEQALALWRGEALVDLVPESCRARLVRPWEERRLRVVEARDALVLAHGDPVRLIPELTALVADHPGRSRSVEHLMLALHRCGRDDEALATFRRVRQSLAEQHGIEPAAELLRLHERILRNDPELRPARQARDKPSASTRP